MNKNLLTLLVVIILATVMYIISGLPQPEITTCTQEALVCADGSTVRRTGKKCEFAACPAVKKVITPTTAAVENKCPETEWVDCMPGPGKVKIECAPQYLRWAKDNCPKFKGAAY